MKFARHLPLKWFICPAAARRSEPTQRQSAHEICPLPPRSMPRSAPACQRRADRYDRRPALRESLRRAAARNSGQSRRRTVRRRRRTNRRAAARKSRSAAWARHRAKGMRDPCRADRAATRDGCGACFRRGRGCRARRRCRGRPAWDRAASERRRLPLLHPVRGCRRRRTARRPRSRRRP